MPAHKTKQAAGQFRCGNGEWLTEDDIRGNAEADRLAKAAVQQYRVDSAEVSRWEQLYKDAMATAKWIARATWVANNCEEASYRDSEASQWRAAAFKKEAKAKRAAAKAGKADGHEHQVDDGRLDLKGHNPVKVLQLSGIRSGWRCTTCKKISSKKRLLVSRPCSGCPLEKWKSIEKDSDDEAPVLQTHQHTKMLSGTVLWCSRCEVFADQKSKGLKNECKGKPPRHKHRGGMEGQLRKLRMGIHPKTRAALPTAIEVDPVLPPARSNDGDEERVRPLGFYEYVPEIFLAARPACTALGSSTAVRQGHAGTHQG